MKATGIVRRIDDLGRVVIPKEIRRTMRIREGDPLHTSLTPFDRFCVAADSFFEKSNSTVSSLCCLFYVLSIRVSRFCDHS